MCKLGPMSRYLASVGIEVHAELLTRTKMFCRCPAAFGGEPNSRTCPTCLGLPGALPVPNRQAVDLVLRTALALSCEIATPLADGSIESVFHRKSYVYPDLPKGYQISQYGETNPIGHGGFLDLPSGKRVRIRRVHLEEDTGKLVHLPDGSVGVDYNRAGVPLMEIVTELPPDVDSPEEAREYVVALRHLLVWLGVCDGRLEAGSMRCEPNVSVRLACFSELGVKTELKNLNSFRSVQLGVRAEIERQIGLLDNGLPVEQETRGWNESTETTYRMRGKEDALDYRYFPDPDLLPMRFECADIERLQSELPELPMAKRDRYRREFELSEADIDRLLQDRDWSEFFEEAVGVGGDPKAICNWMNSDFAKMLNESGISARQSLVGPAHLAELANLVRNGTISGKAAKTVLAEAFGSGDMPSRVVGRLGLAQIEDADELERCVREAIGENEEAVRRYRGGQDGVLGYFVGVALKKSGGKLNPEAVQRKVREELNG